MDSEFKNMKKALQNRKAELQKLIDQMKADQLYKGSLFRNLEEELRTIEQKLDPPRK